MRIDDIFGVQPASSFAASKRGAQEEEGILRGLFGGKDTVRISQEAYDRLAAEAGGGDSGSNPQGKESDTATPDPGASAAAAGASGAGGAGGGDGVGSAAADQIEELEKQLQKLQSQLMETANNEALPPQEKEARIGAIQSQIAQVTAQIAELKAQQTKKA